MMYTPGLHILATIETPRKDLLQHYAPWEAFMEQEIQAAGLTQVGKVTHDFPGGGFTAVLCLTESHISIHTWPEYGLCTCDVFLSNFRKNNDAITQHIMQRMLQFFESTQHELQSVRR